MKVCKKCKNEYKEDYIYCPKCGQPYDDNMKRVKTPGDVSGSASSVLLLIWNILLYIFGGFTILGSLFSIVEDPVSSIVGILFGLSLFQFIYKIIEDKTMIDTKYLKIARIVIPIVLLIAIGLLYKGDGQVVNNTNSNNQSINQDKQYQKDNQNQSTQQKDNQLRNNQVTNKTQTEKKGDSSLSLYGTSANKLFNSICSKVGISPRPSSIQKGNYTIYAEANMNYNIDISSTSDKDEIMSINLTHYYDNGSVNKDFFLVLTELEYDGSNKNQLADWINVNIGTNAETKIGSLNFKLTKSDENYVTLSAKTDKAQ